jgi:hypothetical protein
MRPWDNMAMGVVMVMVVMMIVAMLRVGFQLGFHACFCLEFLDAAGMLGS